ncbi:MAG TPA: hypothetical protein VG326_04365 [Tepidisphaeraceae bacterium]|nr:hypothetical protein [Tepidisphaeraceae bacterium]
MTWRRNIESLTGLLAALVFTIVAPGFASDAISAPIDEIATPAVTMNDVDVANCRVIRGAISTPAAAEFLLDVLNATAPFNHGWLAPKPLSDADTTPVQYLLVFKQPVAAGTVEFAGSVTTLRVLKPGVGLPVKSINPTDWLAIDVPPHQSGGAVATLAPGTLTQALLFTDPAPQWGSRLAGLRVMKSRLYNLTPSASAFAESEYVAFHSGAAPGYYLTAHITSGESPYWQNNGTDSKGLLHRPPISDFAPSWVMLTWRQPQTVGALWMSDNFTDLDVEYYVGPDSLSPRAGTEMDWKTIRDSRKIAGYGRMIQFSRLVTTRGIRINILATADGPIARLLGLHVLTDLKDQPIPRSENTGAQATLPPIGIPYAFDFDGLATMVVNGSDGHRVRNLFAREKMTRGKHVAGWDLKDELGNMAPPGVYEWKALAAPPLGLKYEMTCYPNVHENSPENAPWLTGMSGPGGWMADESSPRAGAVSGDTVFLGSPVCESGVCFMACDLRGKKLWAINSFAAWAGSYIMAADGKTVFTMCFNNSLPDETKVDVLTDRLFAVDIATHQFRELAQFRQTASRKRASQWAAAFDNKVYVSVSAPTDWLASPAAQADADLDNCYPRYAVKRKERFANEDVPDPRADFMGLFRMAPLPPRSKFLEYIESMPGRSPRHHVMMTFRKPVAIGTVVLPRPMNPDVHIKLSVLKPDAPYPPNAGDPRQWQSFETQPTANWDAATAPKNCLTRALRVSFIRGDEDPLNETDDSAEYSRQPLGAKIEFKSDKNDDTGLIESNWAGQLEGLKMIGRRFENVAPAAAVHVNSGVVDKAGEWDARRDKPLSDVDPGIYELEWKTPQAFRGLAFKEIDGARTEIDVYTGGAAGDIDITSNTGWTRVKTYLQRRRTHYIGKTSDMCRYMDGYVDFGKEIQTRAIRLRVVEQWSDFAGEEALRWDLKDKLDAARCRIFGVAATQAYVWDAKPQAETEFLRVLTMYPSHRRWTNESQFDHYHRL